eukprot:TRINITY_DN10084_c0_g1_i1.p1 TRINITY_DN10084_c0_g1~~TRINITY_DN10084_c0_g1_i1.p1  ORF type:complete len:297 (-),score=55.03 TRINITY_DN10084_c0_g1_i1:40-807(-)
MKRNQISVSENFLIGPILPPWLEQALDNPESIKKKLEENSDNECIQFMNNQKEKSVLYIALGSHCTLSVEQGKLIIDNLRKFNVKWILLCRDKKDELKKALRGGGEEDGIVTAWAPQIEIMVHPALKCVLSHGGFGTMIEGVFAGAPFITSPVMSDQFMDTRVLKHLGICLGSISENRFLSVMERQTLSPFFPDDGGKAIAELFAHVFGSEEGEKELENARAASRNLRNRMLDAKNTKNTVRLEELRHKITSVSS